MRSLGFIFIITASAWAESPIRQVLSRDLNTQQREGLTALSSTENLVKRLNPKQAEAARVRLRDLERGLPQTAAVLGELGDAYLALKSPADAARVAAQLQTLKPDQPDGYRMAAQALFELGNMDDAEAEALRAGEKDPRDLRALAVLKLVRGRGRRVGPWTEKASVISAPQKSQVNDQQPIVETTSRLANMNEPPAIVVADQRSRENASFPWWAVGGATVFTPLSLVLLLRKKNDAQPPEPLVEERFSSGLDQAAHYDRVAKWGQVGRKTSWVTLYASVGLAAGLATYGALTYAAPWVASLGTPAMATTEGMVIGGESAVALAGTLGMAAAPAAVAVGGGTTMVVVDATQDIFRGAQISNANPEYQRGGYNPPPEDLKGFPDAKPVKVKTGVKGGGGMRRRWKSPDGKIYEWDSRHGRVEVYNKRGRHLGEFNPDTGKQVKPGNPARRVEP